MSQRRRMSIAGGEFGSASSPALGGLGLMAMPDVEATAEEVGHSSLMRQVADAWSERVLALVVQVEELEARVAELEEELEETRQNLEMASSIGQQMVERLQQIEEENEELRVGNMAPDAIHQSEIVRVVCRDAARICGDWRSCRVLAQAKLESTLQETQEDFARVSSELVSAQAQLEWLEGQASGVETEELLRMIDGKDRILEEKDTEIERLNGKLEEANRAARRHAEVRPRLKRLVRLRSRRA